MSVETFAGQVGRQDPETHSLVDRGAVSVILIAALGFLAPAVVWVIWGPTLTASGPPAIELQLLVWSALLALALPLLQIVIHIRRFGGDKVRGNRDGYPEATGAAARIARAHANLIESLVPFAAVVLSAHAGGVSNRITVAASVVYLAARLTHAISYVLGVTVVRSAAFYAGLGATAAIALEFSLR
jgi:uncharacterized MAPEG superfamily protein